MKTFVDSVAEYLLETFSNLNEVSVIFPNRRPSLFLYQAIGKHSEKPVFAPKISSIRDFIYAHSNLKKADNITLLFRLFKVYSSIHQKETAYSFEHFISSGELMLTDFNDIDNYMVQPQNLFSNIDKVKLIEQWNPGKHELTELETQYLEFFHKLYDYYSVFTNQLLQDGLAYDGLAYRTLAEKIKEGNGFREKGQKYIFAGFNALNAAEKIIIDHFVSNIGSELIWDADISYVQDEKQEAGTFLRQNLQQWQNKNQRFINEQLFSTEKHIHIIGAPLSLSQAKYAGQIANEIFSNDNNEINNTVIVPADESMLPSLLESIPEQIEHINITMGYELKNTVIFQFIHSFIRLFSHLQKQTGSNNDQRFSYSSLIEFIKQPYFRFAFSQSYISLSEEFVQLILDKKRLFYSTNDLEKLISTSEKLTASNFENFITQLKHIQSSANLNDTCIELTLEIAERHEKTDTISRNMIVSMKEILLILRDYIQSAEFNIGFSLYELLFRRLAGNMRVPFEGEPLGGLQIMGFLETRCLDFKNVILTNVNEGFLPSGNRRLHSFIPFDLRKYFGMPLPAHKDAMFGYYFLRLLQRAQNIWLLYNTEPDVFSGKEMSRYIRQIEYEFKHRAGKNWNISHRVLQIPLKQRLMDKVHSGAGKNKAVLDKIENRFVKGFSASSLYQYIECPFRFYLSYVIGIRETKSEISQSVESDILGTVVHETLKEIYKSQINNPLNEVFFKAAAQNMNTILDNQFEKHYPGGDMNYGKNLIIQEVARNMVRNVLKEDRKQTETGVVIPLYLENDLQVVLENETNFFSLYGKFDRIFKQNGEIRITDYKTGKVDSLRLLTRGKNLSDLDFNTIDGKKFQLLFYLLLYKNSELSVQNTSNNVRAGIMPLRKFNSAFVPLEFSEKEAWIPDNLLDDFKLFIFSLIDEIKNPDIPFVKTSNSEKCRFCIYISVCNYFSPIFGNDTTDE